MLTIEPKDILQKTMILEEPAELSGINLRNRNAMQLVDLFEKQNNITLRLTALYMDYSMTHIGFSLDPPYSDWNISDVTIVDDRGKTYWVSISRSPGEDPFFPIRIITDSIASGVEELMISVKRIYLPNREMEEGYEETLSIEEEKIYDNIPSLGDDGSISLEIKEINKKLRELERKRFFHLPIVKEQVEGRWSFIVPIDHSIRTRIHRLYRLKNTFSLGPIRIFPCNFKMVILRNELVCEYQNDMLKLEFEKEGRSIAQEESIIFGNNIYSPIPPVISIHDSRKNTVHFPDKEHQGFFERGAGNVIWTNNKKLLLHYKFNAFECNHDEMEFCLSTVEMPGETVSLITLDPGGEKEIELPVYTGGNKRELFPLQVHFEICETRSGSHYSYAEIKYSYPRESIVEEFWIPESRLIDGQGNVFPVCSHDAEKEDGSIKIKNYYELRIKKDKMKFKWQIKNYYYRLKEPLCQKFEISGIVDPGEFEKELSGGKVILPGKTA